MRSGFLVRILGAVAIAFGCLPTYSVAPPCGSSTDADNCGACGHACGHANTDGVKCAMGMCAFQCAGSFAHCSSDDATGCETNLGTSASDCGACGHSCRGGECVAGICQPIALAGPPNVDHGLKNVNAMVTFGGSVYGTSWYRGGLVFRLSPTPGDPLEWLGGGATIAGSASPIATDGTHALYGVFWNDVPIHRQGLWKIDGDGSNDTLIVPGDGNNQGQCPSIAKGDFVDSIASDGTNVFFTHSRDAGSPCPGIVRADADGSNATLHLSGWRFSQLAIDADALFAINVTNSSIVAMTKTLDATTVLAMQGTPTTLRLTATHVYWHDQNAKAILRVPKTGGMIEEVTPSNINEYMHVNFVVDDPWLYVVTPPADYAMYPVQSIHRSKSDRRDTATVVAKIAMDNMSSFTQDDTAIYWATHGDDAAMPTFFSTVYKLAK